MSGGGKVAHTAGPWRRDRGGYIRAGDLYVAEMLVGPDCADLDSGLANGDLIAAAPSLLEALVSIVCDWENPDCGLEVDRIRLDQARAAIAAARGEVAK